MDLKQITCESSSFVVRRVTGIAFARLIHHYFGNTKVVLIDGEKRYEFVADQRWLDLNRVQRLKLSEDDVVDFFHHVRYCQNAICVEAGKRSDVVHPLLKTGSLPGDLDAVALRSVFASRRWGDYIEFEKGEFGEFIDACKPFFSWFTEHPEDWVWPQTNY